MTQFTTEITCMWLVFRTSINQLLFPSLSHARAASHTHPDAASCCPTRIWELYITFYSPSPDRYRQSG
ncbi:uncharacterized protein EI90DRAFT_3032554 [Cantharellus anzutake]|uniref:uncharacterized protein n=1 Tax=Cantharellus anzutake TaxID=1750568 RepID=UPI001906A061|nr:uncharacterized protein EI90DRAFT_3032554 [Cantharellus anzutake]KAF8342237.1 hypothetical protein EI90DRAFT_3032554 [Cantharellus anzutake]